VSQIIVVAITVTILAALTCAVVALLRLEKPWLQPIAVLRAVVQLGLLSIILLNVVSNGLFVAAFLVIMIGAATWVVIQRLALTLRDAPRIAASLAVTSAVPVVVVFATGAVQLSPRYVLAVGGIVIGNAMTVSTLMGRSLSSQFASNWEEIEAWLALGATPRRSAVRLVRSAASTSLIPSTDQTRTTGIVTLPGAFVGAIFAGASPLAAAEFQLIVLAAILVTGALTAALFSWFYGAPAVLPINGDLRLPRVADVAPVAAG
jgi:putative ABC transport system permease protein